jgi:hypothetical protein
LAAHAHDAEMLPCGLNTDDRRPFLIFLYVCPEPVLINDHVKNDLNVKSVCGGGRVVVSYRVSVARTELRLAQTCGKNGNTHVVLVLSRPLLSVRPEPVLANDRPSYSLKKRLRNWREKESFPPSFLLFVSRLHLFINVYKIPLGRRA